MVMMVIVMKISVSGKKCLKRLFFHQFFSADWFLYWFRRSFTGLDMGCLGGKTEEERLDEKTKREANKKIERQLQKERQAYKATHRLLLLGEKLVCMSVTFTFL